MQIVIDIPDEQYNALCMKGVFILESQLPSFLKVLRNGTPLPKGHGDLIDRKDLSVTPIDVTDLLTDKCLMVYYAEDIEGAPVLIPADKEGE